MVNGDSSKAILDAERSMQVLAEITSAFSRTLDLHTTLNRGLDRIMDLMEAEAASIFLYEPDQQHLVCRACAGPQEICDLVQDLRLDAGSGIVGRAAAAHEALMVRDVMQDPDFAAFVDEKTGFTSRSIIAAPLWVNDVSLGAIEVINKRGDRLFNSVDSSALSLMATASALAIHNARIAAELVEQERIQRELELAREIQGSLMPDTRADYPVMGINRPAREVSGDFFDFYDIPGGRIGFNLADVSGKGMNAALLGVKASSLLRSLGRQGIPPGELLALVNDEIAETATRGMFITAVAGIYDPQHHHIEYANAGHPPPMILTQDQARGAIEPEAESPPLGIAPGMRYSVRQRDIGTGRFFLYSDGLTEMHNSDGTELGLEGLLERITATAVTDSDLTLQDQLLALSQGQDEDVQHDDITLLVVDGGMKPAHQSSRVDLDSEAGLTLMERVNSSDRDELVHIAVPAVAASLRLIRSVVGKATELIGCDPEKSERLVLAVNEACMNVIQHAYSNQGTEQKPSAEEVVVQDIQLAVWMDPKFLWFEIIDHAPPCEEQRLQGRELDDIRPGGLGLHFITEIMDQVHLGHLADGSGNRLLLGKSLSCRQS